jgi:hypothetical protein
MQFKEVVERYFTRRDARLHNLVFVGQLNNGKPRVYGYPISTTATATEYTLLEIAIENKDGVESTLITVDDTTVFEKVYIL